MKSVSIGIQKRTQRRSFLRPDRSLCSELERPSLAGAWRYVATEQRCVSAWSLCSEQAWLDLGRYVAIRVCARSLRDDRAVCVLGRYVATELCACLVAMKRPSLA
ncbi:hypothetical protein DY000_02017761 [Brassica cretica]|uniref:Uncharacterized protein n=1 Tax=Brassica cretica TaxID=69181 RepID=A0ABQ7D6T5_BRACR|nr:hypothetical protein DY000_02017761 [Brassica cretica]